MQYRNSGMLVTRIWSAPARGKNAQDPSMAIFLQERWLTLAELSPAKLYQNRLPVNFSGLNVIIER